MEHRWGQRSDVDLPVRLTCNPYAIRQRAYLLNVSVTGAFVATKLQLPLLANIQVDIELPDPPRDCPLQIGAYVVRRSAGGLGLEWHELMSRGFADTFSKRDAVRVRGASDAVKFRSSGTEYPSRSDHNQRSRPRISRGSG